MKSTKWPIWLVSLVVSGAVAASACGSSTSTGDRVVSQQSEENASSQANNVDNESTTVNEDLYGVWYVIRLNPKSPARLHGHMQVDILYKEPSGWRVGTVRSDGGSKSFQTKGVRFAESSRPAIIAANNNHNRNPGSVSVEIYVDGDKVAEDTAAVSSDDAEACILISENGISRTRLWNGEEKKTRDFDGDIPKDDPQNPRDRYRVRYVVRSYALDEQSKKMSASLQLHDSRKHNRQESIVLGEVPENPKKAIRRKEGFLFEVESGSYFRPNVDKVWVSEPYAFPEDREARISAQSLQEGAGLIVEIYVNGKRYSWDTVDNHSEKAETSIMLDD